MSQQETTNEPGLALQYSSRIFHALNQVVGQTFRGKKIESRVYATLSHHTIRFLSTFLLIPHTILPLS